MGEAELDTLESKGLIRLATVQPELEYLFRHALVQDAAYESLLKQERRSLHRQVGDALEMLYPERHGELAAVLARHFEQAGETDKAIEYLVEAARYAYERHAVQETFELLTRARDLLPPRSSEDSMELRTRRVEIEFGRQKAGFAILSSEETVREMGPLIDEVDQLNNPRLAADVHLHAALIRLYSREGADSDLAIQRSLDRVAEIAVELDDPAIAAMPNSIIGLFSVFTGRLAEGVAMLQQAAPVLAQSKDSIGSSFARMALGIGLARMGRFDEAEAAIDVAMEVAERGDLIARLDSRIGRAIVRQTRGDEDSAIRLAHECVALAEETGATACLISSSNVLGDSLMQTSDFPAARIAYQRGSTVADITGERMFRPSLTASLRSVAANMGEFNPSSGTFDEALAEAESQGDAWARAFVLWRRAQTESKMPTPNEAQMLSDFEAAAESFEEMGSPPFLARVLRDWGHALRSRGVTRVSEDADTLPRAIAVFESVGLTREADELRAELAAG